MIERIVFLNCIFVAEITLMGSFEGYIYTKIRRLYQMLGYPEAILYVLLFIGILHVSIKYVHRRIITLLSILIMALICFLGIMSFVMA